LTGTADPNFKFKFDTLDIRVPYFMFGTFTIFSYDQTETAYGKRSSAYSLLPFGLCYPIAAGRNYALAIESTFYLLEVSGTKDSPVKQPKIGEVALSYTPGKFISVAGGYRRILNPGDVDALYDTRNEDGLFVNLSVGLIFTLNHFQARSKTVLISPERAAESQAAMDSKLFLKLTYEVPNLGAGIGMPNETKDKIEQRIKETLESNGFILVEKEKDATGIVEIALYNVEAAYENLPTGGTLLSSLVSKYDPRYESDTMSRLGWNYVWKNRRSRQIFRKDSFEPQFPTAATFPNNQFEADIDELIARIEAQIKLSVSDP
jgi:hypothetical protein